MLLIILFGICIILDLLPKLLTSLVEIVTDLYHLPVIQDRISLYQPYLRIIHTMTVQKTLQGIVAFTELLRIVPETPLVFLRLTVFSPEIFKICCIP